MSPLELATLKFWNAAVFVRRAPERCQSISTRILQEAAVSDHQKLRDRATDILKGTTDVRKPANR